MQTVERNKSSQRNVKLLVSGTDSTDDNWTCSCLYKCNECLKIEAESGNKYEYFERKDLDYWDE